MYACVGTHVCARAFTHASVCMWRLEIKCCPLGVNYLVLWVSLSRTWSLPSRLGWLGNEALGLPVSPSLALGLQACTFKLPFYRGCLGWKWGLHTCTVSHLSSPITAVSVPCSPSSVPCEEQTSAQKPLSFSELEQSRRQLTEESSRVTRWRIAWCVCEKLVWGAQWDKCDRNMSERKWVQCNQVWNAGGPRGWGPSRPCHGRKG